MRGLVSSLARRPFHAGLLFAFVGGVAAQPEDVASLPLDVALLDPVELHGPLPGVPFPGPPGPVDGPVGDVTDEQIATFAEIYVDLQKTARKFERTIAQADSEEEAQEIQARLQTDSMAVLEKRGWSAEEFDRIARALNRRPDLAAKALLEIEDEG